MPPMPMPSQPLPLKIALIVGAGGVSGRPRSRLKIRQFYWIARLNGYTEAIKDFFCGVTSGKQSSAGDQRHQEGQDLEEKA